jgi:3-hydroxyisobutyrate dehydrogenase
VLRGDFNPGFFVEHFLKDLQIALEEAESVGLGLEATALARRLYEHAVAGGRGRLGTQSLALVLEERWRRGLPVG